MIKQFLFFFMVVLFAGMLSRAEESKGEVNKFKFEAFGTISRTIVNQIPFQYSSYLLGFKSSSESKDSWTVGVDRSVFGNPKLKTSTERWNAIYSYSYKVLKELSISASIIHTGINRSSPGWLGLIGLKVFNKGEFENPNLISEFGYSLNIDSEGYGYVSGFGRLGWSLKLETLPESVHLKFDPLLGELKGYSTNNENIYGYHFGVLSAGPRLRISNSSDTLGASLYVTETRNVIKGYSHSIASEWATLSLDAQF